MTFAPAYGLSDPDLTQFCASAVRVRPSNWAKALEVGVTLNKPQMLSKALKIATTHEDCKDDASAGIGGLLLEIMKTQKRQEQQLQDLNELLSDKLNVLENLLRNK